MRIKHHYQDYSKRCKKTCKSSCLEACSQTVVVPAVHGAARHAAESWSRLGEACVAYAAFQLCIAIISACDIPPLVKPVLLSKSAVSPYSIRVLFLMSVYSKL